MTTGTDEFGPAEFGAGDQEPPFADQAQGPDRQPRPIPGRPGAQPGPARRPDGPARAGYGDRPPAAPLDVQVPDEQLPWIGGGSMGYAEAVFGANSQAATSASPIGPRSRLAPPVPDRSGPQPLLPQQPAPHQSEFPQTDYPQTDYPRPEFPQGEFGQAEYPQAEYAQSEYPQSEYPQSEYPQPDYQQGGQDAGGRRVDPRAAGPRGTAPQQGGQRPGAAPQGVPRQAAPQQPAQHQVASYDAPTTEFFPGAFYDQPYPPQASELEQQQHQQAPVEEYPQQQPEYGDYDARSPQSPGSSGGHWTARPDQPEQSPLHSSGAHSVRNLIGQAPTGQPQAPQAPAPQAQAAAEQSAPAQPAARRPATIQPGLPSRGDQGRPHGLETMAPPRRGAQSARAAAPAGSAPARPSVFAPASADQSGAHQVPVQPAPVQPAPAPAVPAQAAPNEAGLNQGAVGQPGPNQTLSAPAAAPVSAPPAQPQVQVPAQPQAAPAPAQTAAPAAPVPPPAAPKPRTATRVGAAATRPAARQPEPQPAPPVVQAADSPAGEPGDDEADELIVPWQAVAPPVPPQPAEPGIAQQQAAVAAPAPAPVKQAPVSEPELADEAALDQDDLAEDDPQAQNGDDQAPETALIPRGTRRRGAQQYPADEQEQAVQQPVQQVVPANRQADRQATPSVSAFASTQQQQLRQTPTARQQPAAAVVPVAAGSDNTSGSDRAPGYDHETLAAVYRVIHERRDVRNDFLPDPVPIEMLTRILEAAHTAPSVGFSQPWDFLVIRDQVTRESIHDLAVRQRRAYAASLPKARAQAFAALKIESILDTPVNIVVTCDPTRGGRHTLGRYSQPMMAPFSSCLAVENLWLAARAEGLGVGWVSFFDERELAAVLDLPNHLQIVAYLCVGFVKQFPTEPELAGSGWAKRRPLSWAVHEETFGHRAMPGAEPISLLNETIDAIRPLDPAAMAAARDRQNRMTKPPGSLGALEAVSEQLAGLAGECPPPAPEPAALAVFAGDHGVHAQGVTPWPQEVTAQMVGNFLAGGAVINAFAKQVGAEVCVVDVGVAADLTGEPGLVPRKIRYGTADMTIGPAMSRSEAIEAVEAGIETARDLIAAGNRCLLTGDMGIANTTASAALIATFTGASPAQVTGYGTGIDEQTYAHKVDVVHLALQLHQPDPQDPIGVLAAFGGLEHAALAGFILGAAALRIPVILDGVIAGAAALVAQALAPDSTAACVAGHRSAEPGHALALEALEISPLIDLELRLGEGSGAALALPLVGAAVRALREVATFDDAGVAEAQTAPPAGNRAVAQGQARALPQGQGAAQIPAQATAQALAGNQPQQLPAAQPQSRGRGQQQPARPQPRIPQARSADRPRSAAAAPTAPTTPGTDA